MQHTADIFDPDLFIVDKEPLGLRGEVGPTLELLRRRGTPIVLGLRDVMDEPAQLGPEWSRKKAVPALKKYYDDIWVYGLPPICEILSFDKRALIVPRTQPRLEQYIRAARAQELGLVRMLTDDGARDPHVMATALRQLPQQNLPSDIVVPGLLDGFDSVNRLA